MIAHKHPLPSIQEWAYCLI